MTEAPQGAHKMAQREGLSLLFVQRPDDKRSHAIVIGAENVQQRVFEDALNASQFPLEKRDLAEIGNKLRALGAGLSKEQSLRFFKEDEFW